MESKNDVSDEVVFEYTGEGCEVPENVTIVRFHSSVTEVENNAFDNCKKLREVTFNDVLQQIGDRAFRGCVLLSSVTIPSTVTEIKQYAFRDCVYLSEVVLNDGLKKIGVYAFYNCKSLSSIILPSTTVTEIGEGAFSGCSNLGEVMFNDGLQKIGGDAFLSCTSLSSITLPSTLTEIDKWAFQCCSNLREVVFHGVPQKIGKEAFSYCPLLGRFTFPTISNRLDNLIQTGHWEDIENEVNEVRGVLERSDGDYFVSAQTMREGHNWNAVRRDIDKIIRLIFRYELKEATSMLELALWKFKLDQVDKANPIPRKKCRMDVPGPVKDIILQYLPYECRMPVSDLY